MRRNWRVLVACTPIIVNQSLDVTMINVALPSMGVALSAQLADLQWVVAAFALAMVSLLPTSAAVGDLYSRRRALLIGYGMFAFGAALAWSATSIAVLLPARIAQGIGMALGAPNAFAMVALSFPEEQRGRALGLWTGISSLLFMISPILGGWLVESFGFNAVFIPSFLFAVIGGAGTWLWIPVDPPRRHRPLDLIGITLATGALSLLSYGLIEGGRAGFERLSIVATLALGLLFAWWFIRYELHVEHPMLDLRIVRQRPFGPVILAAFTLHTTAGVLIFFLTIYLQALRGFSPSATARVLMAFSAMVFIIAPVAGYLTDRIGFRYPIALGLPAVGLGALFIAAADRPMPVMGYLLAAMVLVGVANGAFFVSAGTAAVSRFPDDQTSTAGASLSVSRHLGVAFGIAVFGSLATILARVRFRSAIADRQDAAEHGSSMSFGAAPEGLDGVLAAAHADASLSAFVTVMVVIGVCALVVGGLVIRLLFTQRIRG